MALNRKKYWEQRRWGVELKKYGTEERKGIVQLEDEQKMGIESNKEV